LHILVHTTLYTCLHSFTITSLGLPPGTYNVTATFEPNSSAYMASTSLPVTITVPVTDCPGTLMECVDTQNVDAIVNPGSLTITTPYTPTNPFVLPAMQLSSDGKRLETSARFPYCSQETPSGPNAGACLSDDPQIVIQSSLAGNPDWTGRLQSAPPISPASQDLAPSPFRANIRQSKGTTSG
jgi:hypothetical protein